MRIKYLMLMTALLPLVWGCRPKVAAEEADTQPLSIAVEGFKDTVEIEMTPVLKSHGVTKGAKASKGAEGPRVKRVEGIPRERPKAKAPALRETLYVESYDSRGRVWGHVTMQGDRGSGTIHDEGENTWAVSVTRHGDELFAVDQNSRQYVFKIKQK